MDWCRQRNMLCCVWIAHSAETSKRSSECFISELQQSEAKLSSKHKIKRREVGTFLFAAVTGCAALVVQSQTEGESDCGRLDWGVSERESNTSRRVRILTNRCHILPFVYAVDFFQHFHRQSCFNPSRVQASVNFFHSLCSKFKSCSKFCLFSCLQGSSGVTV